MKGVSYARFSTTLCLAGGFVKRRWPPGKANAFKSIADKNSQSNPPIILSNHVQYWTAIYSGLAEDADIRDAVYEQRLAEQYHKPYYIMIQETPQADLFKQQMRESLRQETLNSRAVTIAKHDHVYTCGDNDGLVYFIESGQVKLLMLSPEGRECLLAIHTAGDIFGELCLSGLGTSLETATAMEETILKQIPCPEFLACLGRDALFECFAQYLAVRSDIAPDCKPRSCLPHSESV